MIDRVFKSIPIRLLDAIDASKDDPRVLNVPAWDPDLVDWELVDKLEKAGLL